MGGNEPKEFQGLGLLAHYSMKVQFCTAYFKKKSENFVFFFRFMLFSRFVLFTVKRKRPSLRSCSRKSSQRITHTLFRQLMISDWEECSLLMMRLRI